MRGQVQDVGNGDTAKLSVGRCERVQDNAEHLVEISKWLSTMKITGVFLLKAKRVKLIF